MKIKMTAIININEKANKENMESLGGKDYMLSYYNDALNIWLNEDCNMNIEVIDTNAIEHKELDANIYVKTVALSEFLKTTERDIDHLFENLYEHVETGAQYFVELSKSKNLEGKKFGMFYIYQVKEGNLK